MFVNRLFDFIIGLIPYISPVIDGRFFEGLCSAIPSIIAVGSIKDMYLLDRTNLHLRTSHPRNLRQ